VRFSILNEGNKNDRVSRM